MKCQYCGSEVKATTRYCGNCGKEVLTKSQKQYVAIIVSSQEEVICNKVLNKPSISIGRGNNNDIVIPDKYTFIDNKQVRLLNREGKLFVEDLGSTIGTYIGDSKEKIPANTPCDISDLGIFRIGKSLIIEARLPELIVEPPSPPSPNEYQEKPERQPSVSEPETISTEITPDIPPPVQSFPPATETETLNGLDEHPKELQLDPQLPTAGTGDTDNLKSIEAGEPIIERTVPETVPNTPIPQKNISAQGICPSCGSTMILRTDRKSGCLVMVLSGLFGIITAIFSTIASLLLWTYIGWIPFFGIALICAAISFVLFWFGLYVMIASKRFKYICPSCSYAMKPKGRVIKERKEIITVLIVSSVIISSCLMCIFIYSIAQLAMSSI